MFRRIAKTLFGSAPKPVLAHARLRFEGAGFYGERQVLRERLEAIRLRCQKALEDAVLMGCDEYQMRGVLQDLIARLENPYGGDRGRAIRAVLSS